MPRKIREHPTQQVLRALFEYEDLAQNETHGNLMRGGFLRRHPPHREVCGAMKDLQGPRALAGVYGWGTFYLHRLIWIWHNGPIPDGLLVDHKNGDPTDNRIRNLRLCNDSQNQMNRRKARAGASVPYIGVSKVKNFYYAFGAESGKPVFLGHSKDPISAALRRDQNAEAKSAEFATLNRDIFPEVRERYLNERD